MPDAISLVRWRDAKTDLPESYKTVITDVGPAYVGHDDDWLHNLPGVFPQGELAWPTVWCDPAPPTSEQLLADLQASVTACDFVADELERASAGRSENVVVWRDRAARVRALLPEEDS